MKRKRIIISTISIIILLSFVLIFLLIKNRSLASNLSITSKNYHIEDNTITNISPNTDIELFPKYFDTTNCSIVVTNENNEPLTNGFVYTGSKTNIYDTTNNLVNTYTNIITGDINYDGLIDIKDIEVLATYLIEENNLDDYQKKAIDINNDNHVRINDLTLLEEYLNSSYQSIEFNKEEIQIMTIDEERLVPTITPNIVLNQNLNWTSSNEEAVTVDETGKVTPVNLGESIITATTKDGLKSANIKVIVDNKPILSESEVSIITGNKSTSVNIKAVDYPDLTCASSNENLVTCTIENNTLIITPVSTGYGNAEVSVTSPNYGTTSLTVDVITAGFNIFPELWCLRPNISVTSGRISPFNIGTITVHDITDREVVNKVTIYSNNLNVETGPKIGKSIVTFIEDRGYNQDNIVVYTYRLSLASTSGETTVGNNLTIPINAENFGLLTCIVDTNNKDKATCQVEDNQLIITPLAAGTATITVRGWNKADDDDPWTECANTYYNLTITEEPEPNEGGDN